mmetsp:Transcript_119275/g.309503  ORF Transcript_119275/g.309503 Transcript_119275/m.309503 type:complete len:1378 (-) Transcript_119275:291-4424(-)
MASRGAAGAKGPPPAAAAGSGSLEDLPIFAHREAILRHIREHRVTHIQGETGCGKSTQVPKYIMEDAEAMRKDGRGDGVTKIVVTQPRRMAAITLARRVASELGEEIGKTVGYKISGDSVGGKLCFVTTGFLLQVLVNQPEEFATYTHVILDEVHERSVDADLLTMLMKLLMQCSPKVRLIVMSATLQAALFAKYFSVVEEPIVVTPQSHRRGRKGGSSAVKEVKPIFVGVRTFPVEEIFLDDLDDQFKITGGFARQGLDKALMGFWNMSGGKRGKGKGKGKGKDSSQASGFKRLEPQIAQGFDELCKELVQQMAREMCTLIVFLPGIADITSFYETLAPLDTSRADRRSSLESWRDDYGDAGGGNASSNGSVALKIYPMHSLIPREEQEEVFKPPAAGICHVVLASNIAESSLTLPSVCGIIDLAMRRSIQYDARRLMSCLVTTWCSQSSCKQRAGRAGRTMPGRAVRLVTRDFFESQMVEFDPPEMLNAPLTKLYLQAKQLCAKLDNMWNRGLIPDEIEMDLSTPTLLLGEVVQPPATTLVEAAITELACVGCIDRPAEDALITPLGYLAMALPCELRLCRLLYWGLMLGCPCDAVAMVAGLTAADPFSTPSLLVVKDQKEYCKKLERSFAARLWCDRGRHSEPLMLRDLFAEWINAGAPRGPRAMGSFAREWNIIPKKFEALASEAVDLCQRLAKLLNPRSPGAAAVSRLLQAMRFSVDRREELVKSAFPTDSEYRKIFSDDVGTMRALICGGFSDQLLVHLKPRWAPSGEKKKKKEEQIVDIMRKQGLDSRGTVCLLNPPQELRAWNAEENHQKLCEAMCGERARRVHWDEKEKLLFYDFKGEKKSKRSRGKMGAHVDEDDMDEEIDPDAVIQDVCPQAHRLHQFGAGRWKFSVELALDDGEDAWNQEPMEILKPIQPFLITWEVVQHTSSGGGKGGGKGAKKPAAVKAMPDWRNPVGFACHAAGTLPPEEHLGVCASVQGLESGASAFVAGATVLGLNHVPLLLTTLDPQKWQVQWGFDYNTGEIRAMKIMHYEIHLPPETLTYDVMWKLNVVRKALLDALTPWPEPQEEEYDRRGGGKGGKKGGGKSGKGGRGSGGGYIWVGDAQKEMADLLAEVWPTPEPVQRPKRLIWQSAAGEHISEEHEWLQPLTEEMDWDAIEAMQSHSQGQGKQSRSSGSKQLGNDKESQIVKQVADYLRGQKSNQDSLSSICGRFRTSPKVLKKFDTMLEVLPNRSNSNDSIVKLVNGSGGYSGWDASGKKSTSSGKGSKGGGKSSAGRGAGQTAGADRRIDELCRIPGVGCQIVDFDLRVRRQIQAFERRRGKASADAAFEMLAEWCSKKDRDSVRSWTAYLMVLLKNWEQNTFGEDDDKSYQ